MSRLRTFKPSKEWLEADWSGDFETVWMPVAMSYSSLNQLLYLQRMTGHAPYMSYETDGTYTLAIPIPSRSTEHFILHSSDDDDNHLLSNDAETEEDDEDNEDRKQVARHIRRFSVLTVLIAGLIHQTGRNEFVWRRVDEITMKRQSTGPETLICQYFQKHPLAEKRLLFLIVEFL